MIQCKPFVVTIFAPKKLSYSLALKTSNIFIFSHCKMAANYATIDRIGKLEVDVQQIPLVEIFTILL